MIDYFVSVKNLFKKSRAAQMTAILFLSLALWFFIGNLYHIFDTSTLKNARAATHLVIAFIGAIQAFEISRNWGGKKNVFGKILISLGFGLTFQLIGTSVFYLYLQFAKIELPYPSLADIGFFGSVLSYIYGAYLLAKSSGVRLSVQTRIVQLKAIFIPLIAFILSSVVLFANFSPQFSQPLRLILDFGYPIGESAYVTLVIFTFIISKHVNGGMMRPRIFSILIALAVQYLADFNFVYQAAQGTWKNGGYGDFIYLLAYFLMTIAIMQFRLTTQRSKAVEFQLDENDNLKV